MKSHILCFLLILAGAVIPASKSSQETVGIEHKTSISGGVIVHRDLEYNPGGHERHRLDLYLPRDSDRKKPLIIWIHGGAWRAGDKGSVRWKEITGRGFAVASINYRLSQHARFPAQLHDCKMAVRWLKINADHYGIDNEKFGVWGASAGGHLAALVGTTGNSKDPELHFPTPVAPSPINQLPPDLGLSRVQAVCDWFGPTDFLQMNLQAAPIGVMDHEAPGSPESQLIGTVITGNRELVQRANPMTYIDSQDPPFRIFHGSADRLVPCGQSILLHQSLLNAGVDSRLTIVPDAGHGYFSDPAVTKASLDFFEAILGNP